MAYYPQMPQKKFLLKFEKDSLSDKLRTAIAGILQAEGIWGNPKSAFAFYEGSVDFGGSDAALAGIGLTYWNVKGGG